MNTTEPIDHWSAPEDELTRRRLESECFGRGVRWQILATPFPRSRLNGRRESLASPPGWVVWSLSISLPISVMAVLLMAFLPVTTGVSAKVSGILIVGLMAVWMLGLLIQCLAVYLWFWRTGTRRADVSITIGGVWTAYWQAEQEASEMNPFRVGGGGFSASGVLMLWSVLLLTTGITASVCWFLGTWADTPTSRSYLVAALDNPWLASAWLIALQGVWQWLPLPQSMGRVGWSALAALFAKRSFDTGIDRAAWSMKTLTIVASILCLAGGTLALQWMGVGSQSGGRPLAALSGVILLSLWLFVSSRSSDLVPLQIAFGMSGDTGRLNGELRFRSLSDRWRARRVARQQHLQLRQAVQRERTEADDAARIDDVLKRLHHDGIESLPPADRALLKRVSEALRKQRDHDQESG